MSVGVCAACGYIVCSRARPCSGAWGVSGAFVWPGRCCGGVGALCGICGPARASASVQHVREVPRVVWHLLNAPRARVGLLVGREGLWALFLLLWGLIVAFAVGLLVLGGVVVLLGARGGLLVGCWGPRGPWWCLWGRFAALRWSCRCLRALSCSWVAVAGC